MGFPAGILGCAMGDVGEHELGQIRLNETEAFFRQPEALRQSRRETAGGGMLNKVVHLPPAR